MIVVRLLWHRYTIGNTLGEKHTAMYTGLAAMFVESAALYGITGLVYLICYARNSYVQNLVLGVLSQTEVRLVLPVMHFGEALDLAAVHGSRINSP